MLERERLQVGVRGAGCRLVDIRPFARRNCRRPIELVTCNEQQLLDASHVVGSDQVVGFVENEGVPIAAGFGKFRADDVLDRAVKCFDGRRRRLIAEFIGIDVKPCHGLLPGFASSPADLCSGLAIRLQGDAAGVNLCSYKIVKQSYSPVSCQEKGGAASTWFSFQNTASSLSTTTASTRLASCCWKRSSASSPR